MNTVLKQYMASRHTDFIDDNVLYFLNVVHLKALKENIFLQIASEKRLLWVVSLYSVYLDFYVKWKCTFLIQGNGQKEKL